MTLESVCDLVLLVGGAYFMIGRIIDSWAKPTSKLKKKKQERKEQEFEKVLDKVMPKYFEKHDLETRDKYLSDRMNYLNEIKQEVISELTCTAQSTLEEIKNINLGQNEDIKLLHSNLEVLAQGTKDMLRQRIMTIYREYKHKQALPIAIREALDELYKDYKAQGGNSYIDKYYNRMLKWKVIYETEYEEE